MNYKNALELQSMFTTAAQIAKATNKQECSYKIQKAVFVELLKKLFLLIKTILIWQKL